MVEALKTFEHGFEEAERAADAASKVVSGLLATTKQMKKAALDGDISAIRRASERLSRSLMPCGRKWPTRERPGRSRKLEKSLILGTVTSAKS
jgi:hypothetical protein